MIVQIVDEEQFLCSIYDYIVDDYDILPRDFPWIREQIFADVKNRTLQYDIVCDVLRNIVCVGKTVDDTLHGPHQSFVYCSIPEIIAARYVHKTIIHPRKPHILKTLQDWLPTVTLPWIHLIEGESCVETVKSDLFPSYVSRFLFSQDLQRTFLRYIYYSKSQPYTDNYELHRLDKQVIVIVKMAPRRQKRRRSRSRSRSRSVNKKRRASRSRSRSPHQNRQRRRSRSRSPRRRTNKM